MDADRIAVRGVWWRGLPHGGDPLFRPDPPPDGRWQRGEIVAAVYLAQDEETAWAEWYRALAEFALPPGRQMPRDLWRFQLDVDGIADLSDAERLAAPGLSPPRPSRRDWPAFQAAGEKLSQHGYAGVLAPSAARAQCLVLCLFRDTLEMAGATPLRPPITHRLAPAPPTGMRRER